MSMPRLNAAGKTDVQVRLVDPDADARAAIGRLQVGPGQVAFVAPAASYLVMCDAPNSPWRPFAVERDGAIVGFVMTAVDPTDNSLSIGGLIIDFAQQGRGTGTAVVRALVERARATGYLLVALTYAPENTAARVIYSRLGFVETDKRDGNEVIALLQLRGSS